MTGTNYSETMVSYELDLVIDVDVLLKSNPCTSKQFNHNRTG